MNQKRLSELGLALLGVFLFGLSVLAITYELRRYGFQDVLRSLSEIPIPHLLLAIAFTLTNYLMLTVYDVLALQYIRRSLSYAKVALASIISYAISNTIGFALLTGSTIRYRFYSIWGFSTLEIANIVAFSNLGFWLGLFAVSGVVFLLEPVSIPRLLHLPFESVRSLSVIFLITVFSYLIWSALGRRSLKIGRWVMPHLSIGLSLSQILVTSLDWALAGGVLYVVLPPNSFSFPAFFSIYLLAQIAGLLSHVPGGLGVVETIVLLLLSPPIPSADLFGALLAYRVIYYLLPLAIALLLLGLYEIRQRLPKSSINKR
jgi:glycosyltransferase 2 family protein